MHGILSSRSVPFRELSTRCLFTPARQAAETSSLYTLERLNQLTQSSPDYVVKHGEEFISVINSYLGMMKHFASYNLRRKIISRISKEWWQVIYIAGHLEKAVLKKRYKPLVRKQREVQQEMKLIKQERKAIEQIYDGTGINWQTAAVG